MPEQSLNELKALALHALKHPLLVELAKTQSPSKTLSIARNLGWPQRQAKAARFLAIVRRDYGPEAFEAFITSKEHVRPKGTEQVQEKPMKDLSNDQMIVSQRLDQRLQILRGEASRDPGAFMYHTEGSLADEVFLEFIYAMHHVRLPEAVFEHLSKTPRKQLLAEVILKCREVLKNLREERNLPLVKEHSWSGPKVGKGREKEERKLWWDAITIVMTHYGVEKNFQRYYATEFNKYKFGNILLQMQIFGVWGPSEVDQLIRDEFFGYLLNDAIMAKIKADFEEFVRNHQIEKAPPTPTREEKITAVAKKLLEDDWINPQIFQTALSDGGLREEDGSEVMEEVRRLFRLKKKTESNPK